MTENEISYRIIGAAIDLHKALVHQELCLDSINSKYFATNRGTKKKHSLSYTTDERRRVDAKDKELIVHEFSS